MSISDATLHIMSNFFNVKRFSLATLTRLWSQSFQRAKNICSCYWFVRCYEIELTTVYSRRHRQRRCQRPNVMVSFTTVRRPLGDDNDDDDDDAGGGGTDAGVRLLTLIKSSNRRWPSHPISHDQVRTHASCTNTAQIHGAEKHPDQPQRLKNVLLDRPFCEWSILCFAHVSFFPNSLFPTSANRYFRNFSTWRGFTRKRSTAMPIS